MKKMGYEAICNKYGIVPLSVEEEAALSDAAKKTRQNKMHIIDLCEDMRLQLYSIENRAKSIPETDDTVQADLVADLTNLVSKMHRYGCAAAMFGR